MGKLINIDNGGTLTDIWVLDGEASYHTKTLTTPYDLSKCFFEGLKKVSTVIYGREDLRALLHSTDFIRYSTTQGTNALVERKGPALGLLLNSSEQDWCCEDEHQRQLFEQLVGSRVAVLDPTLSGSEYQRALTAAVNELASSGASRIVVAYTGDAYADLETRLCKAMLRAYPRHLLGSIPVLYASVLSRNASPNVRLWSALFNAFLHPSMERFLYNTENDLARYRMRSPLLVYRNDGYSGRVAKTIALKTYSSGPRGGAEGALAYSQYYGYRRVVSVDVGGTTTDIGMISDGRIVDSGMGAIEGVRSDIALADIVSVGVGGGSIIKVVDGEIVVGPESVGGAPGPACFGMGGEDATITDALLIIGLLDPKTYFGGKLKLNIDKALLAIERHIALPLGLEVEVACARMLEAWAGCVARGIRNYTEITSDTVLMAFGGGGPMGITAVAESAGVNTVLIPGLSAVFSAHGIGFSDIAHSAVAPVSAADPQAWAATAQRLRERVLRDMRTEGYEPDDCELEAWYEQAGELSAIDPALDFFSNKKAAPKGEVVLGFRALRRISRARLAEFAAAELSEPACTSERTLLDAKGGRHQVPVYRVEDQSAGAGTEGPAILEEAFWTCSVPAGWRFDFTANRDIVLSRLGKHTSGKSGEQQ